MKHQMFSIFLIISLIILPAFGLSKNEKKQDKGKVVTVTGEVIDTACFFSREKRGKKHKGCAQMCIDGGIPAGIVTDDGTVYILNEDHSDKNHVEAYKEVKKHAAEIVTVTGLLIEKSGNKMLFVHKVQTQ